MKKIVFLLLASVLLFSCQNKTKQASAETAKDTVAAVDTASAAKFEFAEKEFDFGTVKEGEKVSHAYTFTNTGKNSLIISNAQASCGCTVPEWTKEPIPPGETGEIKVVFDSKGRTGKQHKTVTVYGNTHPSVVQLQLTGEVKPEGK